MDGSTCACWDCKKPATYDKPLCLQHYHAWERHELEECARCHWFFGEEESQFLFVSDRPPIFVSDRPPTMGGNGELIDPPFLCDVCYFQSLPARQRSEYLRGYEQAVAQLGPGADAPSPWGSQRKNSEAHLAELRHGRPVAAHADIKRPVRWVYIVKLRDGSFYVGQCVNLVVRMKEHADGLQKQTRGMNPRLVYFERFEGDPDIVNRREGELTRLTKDGYGRRKVRELIESWQAPLRLLDLNA